MQLLLTFIFAPLLLLSCKTKAKNNNSKQPLNVVFILTDDQGAHLSAFGTKGLSTPNMDGLAKEGTLFENAFAVVASCSPSRGSILTGMYPHTNGHWRNTHTPELSDDPIEFTRQSSVIDKVGIHEYIKTLPEVLHDNNYYTAITQKFHVSPPWKYPFSERIAIKRKPTQYENSLEDFIDNAQQEDKPFYFQANISPPHRNFDAQLKEFSELIPNPETIEVPAYLPDTPKMRKDLAKYYGCIQLADACVGKIVEVLKEKGVYDNTLIIFTSDQGEPYHRAKASPYYAGFHVPYIAVGPNIIKNKTSQAMISHIDIMPTILDYLDIDIPETVQGTSLRNIFNGKSEKVDDREYIFAEHNSHGPSRKEHYPSRIIFDGRYYYISNLMPEKDYELPADLEKSSWGNQSYQATLDAKETHPIYYKLLKQLQTGRPAEELYDMDKDPGQLTNLAGQDKYVEKQKELKNALIEWRETSGDLADDPLNIPTRLNKRKE